MATPAISAKPDQTIEDVERRMAKHQVRRIPVVDPEDRPIGLLSLNDLAIECAQPDTRMKGGAARIVQTLAAICRPRAPKGQPRGRSDRPAPRTARTSTCARARCLLARSIMTASKDELVSHVAAHAGVAADLAESAARAVLSGIGAHLSGPQRRLVADELPAELATVLLAGRWLATPIEERVLAPGITVGRARELIASVCRVLAEELSDEAMRAMRGCAPPEIAALLAPPAPEVPRRTRAEPRRETLASGRPGSRHPASEARPPGAHTDSIAAENPHAATKLSSTAGSTQERQRETLAEGHPGADQPIAGSRR